MANVSTIGFGWMGLATSSTGCSDIAMATLNGKLKKGLMIGFSGDFPVTGFPSDDFGDFTILECGSGFYLASETGQTYDIANTTYVQKGTDMGRVSGKYVESFTLGGETFQMTTLFSNTKPVYRGSSNYVWYNGSEYSMTSAVGDVTGGAYANGSCLPNAGPYTQNGTNPLETSYTPQNASNFTNAMVTANGDYYQIGFLNGKATYAHALNCDWFMYFNGQEYVISNGFYNTSGIFAKNGQSDIGSGDCSTHGFVSSQGNGTGCVSGPIGEHALGTEDDASVLVTEDVLSVLATEDV